MTSFRRTHDWSVILKVTQVDIGSLLEQYFAGCGLPRCHRVHKRCLAFVVVLVGTSAALQKFAQGGDFALPGSGEEVCKGADKEYLTGVCADRVGVLAPLDKPSRIAFQFRQ